MSLSDNQIIPNPPASSDNWTEPRFSQPPQSPDNQPRAASSVKPAETLDARTETTPAPVLPKRNGAESPLAPATGHDRNGKGSLNGGSGGGGGGNPQLHKRSGDNEFRDVLGKGLTAARRNLITVGIFSLVVNLLVLSIPIYLFNMSDRVLTSRSVDTLIMLSIQRISRYAASSAPSFLPSPRSATI